MPGKKSTKKKSRSKNAKAILANLVVREFNKRTEVKTIAPQEWLNNRITNYLNDPATQCIPLIPSITQGPGQGQRVGNRVRTKKALLTVTCKVDSLTTSSGYVPPVYIDIYIYKVRKSNSVTAVPLDQFLQYGNASIGYDSSNDPAASFFSGNLSINKDQIILKKKKRILLFNQPMISTDFTVNPSAISNIQDVKNARTLNFDITKYLKKNMDYQDDVSNTPEDNLYVSCVFTPNDYATAYAQNMVIGSFSTLMQYMYEDL